MAKHRHRHRHKHRHRKNENQDQTWQSKTIHSAKGTEPFYTFSLGDDATIRLDRGLKNIIVNKAAALLRDIPSGEYSIKNSVADKLNKSARFLAFHETDRLYYYYFVLHAKSQESKEIIIERHLMEDRWNDWDFAYWYKREDTQRKLLEAIESYINSMPSQQERSNTNSNRCVLL